MRLASRLSAFAIAAFVPLAACGDDDEGVDVSGNYQVTSYTTISGDGCTGTPQAVADASFMVLKSGDFFGQKTLEAYVCPALEGCGASEEDFATFTFVARTSTGWLLEASASSHSGSSCSLSMNRQTLVSTDTGVAIETQTSFGTFELSEAQCEPEAAEARANDLTCNQKSTLQATKL